MSSELRRVALRLHSLHAADRAWLLKRLPASERASLQHMLRELRSLGIPATLEPGESPDPPPVDTPDVLMAPQAEAVWRQLQDEDDHTIAVILSARAWPWREAVLAKCRRGRRQSIQRCMGQARPTEAVTTALLEALRLRLRVAGGNGGGMTGEAARGRAGTWRAPWRR